MTIRTLLVLLFLPAAAQAAPFTPFFTQGELLSIQFLSSGTDSICLQCDDADATNDFRAQVQFAPTFGAFPNALSVWGGQISFLGTTATDLPSLNETFLLNVRLSMRDFSPEYPEPSISEGSLFGFIRWAGEGLIKASCCGGQINGVNFQPGGLNYLFPFEFGTLGRVSPIDIHGPTTANYTPGPAAVPEPTSLILLGSGLLAIARRRRSSRT